ncbi:hypothetical protein [Mesorhizobium sp. A556]
MFLIIMLTVMISSDKYDRRHDIRDLNAGLSAKFTRKPQTMTVLPLKVTGGENHRIRKDSGQFDPSTSCKISSASGGHILQEFMRYRENFQPEIPRLHRSGLCERFNPHYSTASACRAGRLWGCLVELMTAAVRQQERRIAVSDAGETGRRVGQPMGDEMHDIPFPLDTAVDADHAGRQHNARMFQNVLDHNDHRAECQRPPAAPFHHLHNREDGLQP